MTEVSEIINRLGGREAVAKRFAVTSKRVEMWERRRKIPGRWHLPILTLANEQGVPLPPSDLSKGARLAEPVEARA